MAFAHGGGRAGRAVVGCDLIGRSSGAAGRRVDGRCRTATALLRRGGGTVSALAAEGADARWVMTLAFAVAGACEVLTGLALRSAGGWAVRESYDVVRD